MCIFSPCIHSFLIVIVLFIELFQHFFTHVLVMFVLIDWSSIKSFFPPINYFFVLNFYFVSCIEVLYFWIAVITICVIQTDKQAVLWLWTEKKVSFYKMTTKKTKIKSTKIGNKPLNWQFNTPTNNKEKTWLLTYRQVNNLPNTGESNKTNHKRSHETCRKRSN